MQRIFKFQFQIKKKMGLAPWQLYEHTYQVDVHCCSAIWARWLAD